MALAADCLGTPGIVYCNMTLRPIITSPSQGLSGGETCFGLGTAQVDHRGSIYCKPILSIWMQEGHSPPPRSDETFA